MNTDGILDFVVEYYIWFIIGGAIIVVALIGFFAEKKKALPSKKKKKKEPEEIVISKEEMTVDKNDIDRLNEDMQNDKSITQNEQINISATDDRTFYKDNFEKAPSEKEKNTENEENNNIIVDTTVKEPNVESIALEETNNNSEGTKTNFEDIQYSLEENKHDFKDENLTNPIFENNMETLVSDIKKIDKMEFLDDNNKKESSEEAIKDEFREKLENEISDEVKEETEKKVKEEIVDEVKEKNITEKNLNENLDDTMQISYSQLKEMVEDIIAENQKENSTVVNKEHNAEEIVETNLPEKNSDIVDMPLPNLENITVDSISKQDEDEDDVWKF